MTTIVLSLVLRRTRRDRGDFGRRLPYGALAVILAAMAWSADRADAEPIAVRFTENTNYAVLALSSTAGEVLADGELIQTAAGHGAIQSRLTFRFKNGAISDETVVFSQNKVFRLLSYRLNQRGPAFPHEMDAAFDRASGRYRVRFREKPGAKEERLEGDVELPADLYNGLATTVIRNLAGRRAEGRLLAFTPKPRLIRMEFVPGEDESFRIGSAVRTAQRYTMKLEVPGIAGVVAGAIGKDPPDVTYWIARPAPAFLKFEGSMFLNGPVWRVEPTRARWAQ